MYTRTAALILLLTALITSALELKLTSGEIINVKDDSDITPVKEPLQGPSPVGAISPRQLFGRQTGCFNPNQRVICGAGCCNNDNYCCEGRSCLWPKERICCQGGHQCYAGGDCCSDGNCCDPGNYCVRNTRTGAIGCRAYSGGSSSGTGSSGSSGSSGSNSDSSAPGSSTTTRTTTRTSTSVTTITFSGSTSTSTTTRTSTSTITSRVQGQGAGLIPSSCKDDGYKPCPDRKFCCPSGSYCYYDAQSAPRCWNGQYFFYYYTYSWSYSFGVRYYTTYTRYNFETINAASQVPAISTPPPPSAAPESNPNPASQSTGVTSTTVAGSSLGVGGLVGGSVGSSATDSITDSSPSSSSASSASTSTATATVSSASQSPFTPTGNAGASPTSTPAIAAGGGATSGAQTVRFALRLSMLALVSVFLGLLMNC